MEFLLHNTASGERDPIQASDGKTVRFYCCGPTVYGPAHIGNFRTFLIQDLFRRVCEASGLKTTHVRNVTDVDDKTIRESMAQGMALREFTASWQEKFEKDCAELNLLAPHHSPSAVDHIDEQIRLIEQLMEKGHAYQGNDGSVYFRVSSFDRYGELAHIRRDAQKENADGRINSDDEYSKDDVADFALWKSRKEEDGANYWESPWGDGRPGWHIECSAMSMRYLGPSIDVHGGGVDLTFPHHENEIAQSEAATGERFVRHWFHSAHLMVEGRKMSKSLGNLYTLADLKEKGYQPEEVRWALLSGHYRKTLNFTFDSLKAAQKALGRIGDLVEKLDLQAEDIDDLAPDQLEGDFRSAWESLLTDLNVPQALGFLMKEISRGEKSAGSLSKDEAVRWFASCRALLNTIGVNLEAWLSRRVSEEDTAASAPEEISKMAEARWAAKKEKDFAEADRLRNEISEAGWLVKDTPDGFELTPVS
tara:strand:+ start:7603 stop:9036 length:1434 start_codon:yes stop_codon:yes gene_type:complete